MSDLFQPLLSESPEQGHKSSDVLSFKTFLELLKKEEDYFPGEEDNTSLMITRIRKIFYDKWGWDTHLIRDVATVQCRYQVEIVDCAKLDNPIESVMIKRLKYYVNDAYQPKCRLVTYRTTDRFGRAGQVPYIYLGDHQDVRLTENYHCDIAHVFAGLDSLNHPQRVSPLPVSLSFLYKFFPYADSNADVATWLGDIATSATDFLHHYLKTGSTPLDKTTEQYYINLNASASDMLGNVDAYVIHNSYNVKSNKGMRITDILENYYNNDGNARSNRFRIYCKHIGLTEWDGRKFSNEVEWILHYKEQLRNTIAFMFFSTTRRGLKSLKLLFKIWKGKFDEVLKPELLLQLWLSALKKQL